MSLEVVRYGPRALLVRFGSGIDESTFQRGCALKAALAAAHIPDLEEIVPAFTTLLLVVAAPTDPAAALAAVREQATPLVPPGSDPGSRRVDLEVIYDGPDLARVATHAGLSPAEAVACPSGAEYPVSCLGFAPGFPYLGGLDPRLRTPRLATPRPRVAAGSVAIGGEQTGVYPVASPGGWHLIGSTDCELFCPQASSIEDTFVLRPGDRVRFLRRDPGDPFPKRDSAERFPAPEALGAIPCLRILETGSGISVQDLGRPGLRRYGVPAGGSMDPVAAGWANRLLDNAPGLPVLELCLQGQRLEVLESGWISVAGSSGPTRSGSSGWSAFRVQTGEVLEFGPGRSGVWTYVAVPGGIAAPSVLGSASMHSRARLGPLLAPGDRLGRAGASGFAPPDATAARRVPWSGQRDWFDVPVVRVWRGPQWDAFSEDQRCLFFSTLWRVSSRSDRVGYRLEGPAIQPDCLEMISEPVLAGTVQVPPDGFPVITMADGPTLGGYPKLGMTDPGDTARIAQVRPGQCLRFVAVG